VRCDLVVALLFSNRRRTANANAQIDIKPRLFSQVQFIDQLLVALGFGPAQIIKQAPALGHHFEEAATRGVILGVALQVFGQLPDPACQQRDLHIGAAGVLPVQLELLDIQRFGVFSHFESAYCRLTRAKRNRDLEMAPLRVG
jgi:hypothetical protein